VTSIWEVGGGGVCHDSMYSNLCVGSRSVCIGKDVSKGENCNRHIFVYVDRGQCCDKPVPQVCVEGRLYLEFMFDDMMRIKTWHFSIRQHRELIPRSILAMHVSFG
jgi:hypothetical protein